MQSQNRFNFNCSITIALMLCLMVMADSSFAQLNGYKQNESKTKHMPSSVPGEFVIQLKNSSTPAQFSEFKKSFLKQVQDELKKSKQFKSLSSYIGNQNLIQLSLSNTSSKNAVIRFSGLNSESTDSTVKNEILKAILSDERIQYAEPNYIYRHFGMGVHSVSDPLFSSLWGLKNTGQTDRNGVAGNSGSDIHVSELWEAGITGSKAVTVAVIDTGVDIQHPDLAQNIYTNDNEIPGNGIDDDQNGFIDDVHGWNFVANTNDPTDDQSHGSHCSGTIGGVANNAQGVVGVNWNVSILPVKFLDANGSGTLENAVKAVQYATLMNVKIMSNSWGGPGASNILRDAIRATKDKGILFVAAAGNSSANNDQTANYPSNYPVDNILAVAATDNRDGLANFSNYGKAMVQVAAPGVGILSTTKNGTYGLMSGTSMATPHVAGVAALLLSTDLSLNYAQIMDRLIRSSDPIQSLGRKVKAKGRVNAYNAIHGIYPTQPAEPAESDWVSVAHDLESVHPYEDNKTYTYNIDVDDAKFIRVIFDKIDTELNYDKIVVLDADQQVIDEFSGKKTNVVSDYISGKHVTIRLKTDSSNTGYGFSIKQIQVIR